MKKKLIILAVVLAVNTIIGAFPRLAIASSIFDQNDHLNTDKLAETSSTPKPEIVNKPNFKKGQDYKTVIRKRLINDGWKPERTSDSEDNCKTVAEMCAQFPELENGPSSGLGHMEMRWRRGTTILHIFTVGEPPIYDNFQLEKAKALTAPPQNKRIEIADGRRDFRENEPSPADSEIAEKEFKAREADIKHVMGDSYCNDQDIQFGAIASFEGAYTKAGAKQKAVLYELCNMGSSHFGTGGLIIFENGKAITHYVYGENGLYNGFYTIPDLTKNGIDVIALTDGQTHQGYTGSGIMLIDLKGGTLNVLGGASTYQDNSGAALDENKVENTAFRITAESGLIPKFYVETFSSKGKILKYRSVKPVAPLKLNKESIGKFHKL